MEYATSTGLEHRRIESELWIKLQSINQIIILSLKLKLLNKIVKMWKDFKFFMLITFFTHACGAHLKYFKMSVDLGHQQIKFESWIKLQSFD